MSQLLSLVRVRNSVLAPLALPAALACGIAFAAGGASAQFGGEHVVAPTGMQLTDVQAADLDGDGDFDVLATHEHDPPITWHRNLGGGHFSDAIALHASDPIFVFSSHAVRTIDYDLDGDLDIVADLTRYHPSVGQSTDLVVYKNAGNATFTEAASYPFIFTSLAGLAVADLEGDGDDDIFYGAWGDASVFVLTSDHGALVFAPALVTDESYAPRNILPTDLDGDGDSDLVVTSTLDNSVTWYENPGRLPFGPQQYVSAAASNAGALSAGDLDGDGDVDVVASGASSGVSYLRWYANQGGSFTAHPITIGSTHPRSVQAADLDGDGDQDLLVGEFAGLSWYANDGLGQFGPRQPIGGAQSLGLTASAADLDGDAVADALSASNPDFTAKIVWFPNLFTAPWTNLLSGLDGVLGVPSLVGSGTLEPGSAGNLVLSAAAPSKPAMLFIAPTSTPAPFKCGTLVPVPVLVGFPVITSPAGSLPLHWNAWPASLSGASLYFQYAISDAAAPCGVALSNALRADVP